MVVLKILVLFLLVDSRERVHCQTVDYYYDDSTEQTSQEPHLQSTKVLADNELTHVRTKNLSGNVKLTTLQVLTTNTPLDKLNNEFENEEEDIWDRTTDAEQSKNKQNLAITITENQQKVASLSDLGTKGPTDVVEPLDLMDVFNSTSGTLPDHVGTEQLISVSPLNFQLIHQQYNLTTPAEKFVAEITNFKNEEKINGTKLERIADSKNLNNRKNVEEVDNIGVGAARSMVADNENEILPVVVTERNELSRKLIVRTPTPKIIENLNNSLPSDKIQTKDSISEIKTDNINEILVSSTFKPTVENTFDSFTTNQNERVNSRFDEVFTTLFPGDKVHREEDLFQKENNVFTEINNFDEYKSSVEQSTENLDDIEDLSTFFTIDEEILNTVTDEISNIDTSNELIDDVSSIMNKNEDDNSTVNEISTRANVLSTSIAKTPIEELNTSDITNTSINKNTYSDNNVTDESVIPDATTSSTTISKIYTTNANTYSDLDRTTQTDISFSSFGVTNGTFITTTMNTVTTEIYATSDVINPSTITDLGSTQTNIYNATNRIFDTTTDGMYSTLNTISTSTFADLTKQTNNIHLGFDTTTLDTTTIKVDTTTNTLNARTFADFNITENSIFDSTYKTQTSDPRLIDASLPSVSTTNDLVAELYTTTAKNDNTLLTLNTINYTFATEKSIMEEDTTVNPLNVTTESNDDTTTKTTVADLSTFNTIDKILDTTTVAIKITSQRPITYDTTVLSSEVITAELFDKDTITTATSNVAKATTDEISTTLDLTTSSTLTEIYTPKTSEAFVNSDATVSNLDQFSTTINSDKENRTSSSIDVSQLKGSNKDSAENEIKNTKESDHSQYEFIETSGNSTIFTSFEATTDDTSVTLDITTNSTLVDDDTVKTSEASVNMVTTLNVDQFSSINNSDMKNPTSNTGVFDKKSDDSNEDLLENKMRKVENTDTFVNTTELDDNGNKFTETSEIDASTTVFSTFFKQMTEDDESTIFDTITENSLVNIETSGSSIDIITTDRMSVNFSTVVSNVDFSYSTSIIEADNKHQTLNSTEEFYKKSGILDSSEDTELTKTSDRNTKEVEENQNVSDEKRITSSSVLHIKEMDKSKSTTLTSTYRNSTAGGKVSSIADSLVTLLPPYDEKTENVTNFIFNGKRIFCTIKVIDNENSFYIPLNNVFKKLQDGFNISWYSSIDQSNSSLQVLQMGSLVEFCAFLNNKTYVHNITFNSSGKDENRNLTVNFGSGVSIYFSNLQILYQIGQDSKTASVSSSAPQETSTLAAGIAAGCLGVAVIATVAIVLIYWTMKKYKSRKQNYNPNGIP